MAKKTAKKQAKRARRLRSQLWFNNPDNPGMTAIYLERYLKELKAGDVLVVWKLNRLGRSLRDLIALLDDLKERGVAFGR